MTQLITVREGNLAVQIYEPKVRKADALLIHGFTGSKEDFAEIGPLLAEQGYRVVASDNRGQYESEHSDLDGGYSIPSLALDHLELTKALGMEKPHLFGHSFGGLVAQRAAVEFADQWASLTIFCSGPQGVESWTHLDRDLEFLQDHSLAELWEQNNMSQHPGHEIGSFMHNRWLMSDKRSVMTHAKHLTSEPSIVDRVKAAGLPIHVIRGENDDAWPHDLQAQMAADLGVEVDVIADAGHSPNKDRPEVTAAAIASFWDSVPVL